MIAYILIGLMLGSILYAYRRKANLSQTIIISNLLIYFIISVCAFTVPEVMLRIKAELGFVPADFIAGKNPYTIFTALYLHDPTDMFHVMINMLMLAFLGMPFEKRVGSLRFGIVYFTTGVSGSLFHTVFGPQLGFSPMATAIGASGAIFGILGAFAYLYPYDEIPVFLVFVFLERAKVIFVAFVFIAIQMAYLVFVKDTHIGYLAHLGGLITGMFLAPSLRAQKTEAETIKKIELELLEGLATTPKLKEILERIQHEDEPAVRRAWVEHLLAKTKCPKCGGAFTLDEMFAKCSCGFKLRF